MITQNVLALVLFLFSARGTSCSHIRRCGHGARPDVSRRAANWNARLAAVPTMPSKSRACVNQRTWNDSSLERMNPVVDTMRERASLSDIARELRARPVPNLSRIRTQ